MSSTLRSSNGLNLSESRSSNEAASRSLKRRSTPLDLSTQDPDELEEEEGEVEERTSSVRISKHSSVLRSFDSNCDRIDGETFLGLKKVYSTITVTKIKKST